MRFPRIFGGKPDRVEAMQKSCCDPPEPDYTRLDSLNCRESRLVWEFFKRQNKGVFVEVGANHPTEQNQTWFLEQQGWSGVLVEPNPALCELLRQQRPSSRVIQAAACGPEQTGEADLHLALCDAHSRINADPDCALAGKTVRVPMRTLDSILHEASIQHIDFLSVDVEGMEVEVLRGLSLSRFQPALILVEDFFYNHTKHRFIRRLGYKLVRRTGYNNWYVPDGTDLSMFSLSTPGELLRLFKKMWLAPPFDNLRRTLRHQKFARQNQGASLGRPTK